MPDLHGRFPPGQDGKAQVRPPDVQAVPQDELQAVSQGPAADAAQVLLTAHPAPARRGPLLQRVQAHVEQEVCRVFHAEPRLLPGEAVRRVDQARGRARRRRQRAQVRQVRAVQDQGLLRVRRPMARVTGVPRRRGDEPVPAAGQGGGVAAVLQVQGHGGVEGGLFPYDVVRFFFPLDSFLFLLIHLFPSYSSHFPSILFYFIFIIFPFFKIFTSFLSFL